MLTNPTMEHLKELKLTGMMEAYGRQLELPDDLHDLGLNYYGYGSDDYTWNEYELVEPTHKVPHYRREITWEVFNEKANRLANMLTQNGIGKGKKVAILLMNCLEWLPVYFGILKAGCVAVPMNFRYSSDEIKYCLDLADCEILIFGKEFIERIDAIADKTDIIEDLDTKMKLEKLRSIINNTLDPRELEIITLRYGLGDNRELTQREIAAKLNISRSYVSRIEKSALKKLRSRF